MRQIRLLSLPGRLLTLAPAVPTRGPGARGQEGPAGDGRGRAGGLELSTSRSGFQGGRGAGRAGATPRPSAPRILSLELIWQ